MAPSERGFVLSTVKSSNLRAVGYEGERNTLTVEFRNGRSYSYADVPMAVYEAMLAEAAKPDGSVGKFFSREIRNNYEAEEITDA